MRKIILVVLIMATFVARYSWYEWHHISHIPADWFAGTITVQGEVIENPDRGLVRTQIVLRPDECRDGCDILVTLPMDASVSYGDRVSVQGKVQEPDSFMTDTGREFDYRRYLAVSDIYATMKPKTFTIISSGNGNRLYAGLFSLRKKFVDTIRKLFPVNEGGLFAGIVIGEKSLLPADTLSDFQIAGLTHMIVLSGFNITIVAIFAVTFLAWCGLGYRSRRMGAFVVIPLFVIMTGFGSSSVRAAIMSLLVFFLQVTTRTQHPLRIILYTAGIMGLINPRQVLYDPSFQMSFIAFVGLIYVTPIIGAWFERFGEWFGLRDLLVETLSVQVFVPMVPVAPPLPICNVPPLIVVLPE